MKIKELEPIITRTAEFSDCGTWRYKATRTWDLDKPWVQWICLNPSLADTEKDDPTVRRMMQYALDWGYGGIDVRNIFSIVSPYPKDMYAAEDPIGPNNDLTPNSRSTLIVGGWGAHGDYKNRGYEVLTKLSGEGYTVHYLALTKGGQPRHPLYLSGSLLPKPLEKGCHF